MPQNMDTGSRKIVPTFAVISQRLMVRLGENRAPACAYQVLTSLLGYSFGKETRFPSHATIQAWCGGKSAIALSTIRKALKWLEDHEFIKRKHHRSKDRYILFVDHISQKKVSRSPGSKIQKIVSNRKFDHVPLKNGDRESDNSDQISQKDDHNAQQYSAGQTQKRGGERYRHERSISTDTNVAQKSKHEENSKPPISPVPKVQGTQNRIGINGSKQSTSRRRTRQERAFLKAQKRLEEERILQEHSNWYRRQRLEKLTMTMALTHHLSPPEYSSDLDHLEQYVQNYLDTASPMTFKLLKINDKEAFLRLTKHLVWQERQKGEN